MATALSVVTGSSRGRRGLRRPPARPGRVRADRPGLGARPRLRAAPLRPGRDHVQGGPRRRALQAPGPQRRRVRPPDQLPPLHGPRPDLDRRDQLLRLQPQPGPARRTERPAVRRPRQDLRQPPRGGGAATTSASPPAAPPSCSKIARRNKQSLNEAALDRNRFNCSYRAGWVMQNGPCVKRPGPVPASQQGGFYVVGDSVSWRADNELADRQRQLDPRPAPRPSPRRAARPAGLVPRQPRGPRPADRPARHQPPEGFQRGRLPRHDGCRSRPAPRCCSCCPTASSPGRQRRPGRGHQEVRPLDAGGSPRQRPLTCLSDWPAIAAHHLSYLVDGEHPDAQHEDWYARYVVRAWGNCAQQLGL